MTNPLNSVRMRFLSIFITLLAIKLYAQDVVEIDLTRQNKIVIKKIIALHDSAWQKSFQESVRLYSYGRKSTHKDSVEAASGIDLMFKVTVKG